MAIDKFSTREIKTKDTYEASFYILWGGILSGVRSRKLNAKTADKKGFHKMWTLTIKNVPLWAIETWRTDQAYGNISAFVEVRTKLKKLIKRELSHAN